MPLNVHRAKEVKNDQKLKSRGILLFSRGTFFRDVEWDYPRPPSPPDPFSLTTRSWQLALCRTW